MSEKAKYYIEKLNMIPHPEGGYFKEIYRSGEIYSEEHLPDRYGGERSFSTSIYYLLEGEQVSTFHKLKSDEIWHFYGGSALKVYIIKNAGHVEEIILGNNLYKGEIFQYVIPNNYWFGAELIDKSSYSLIGCTVAPGFDFSDFEQGKRSMLLRQFPALEDLIIKLTHK